MQDFITQDGCIDLDGLLNSGTFTLGLSKGRKYGDGIDVTLDKYRNSAAIYERSADDQMTGLVKMFNSKIRNINGIIGFPPELRYISSQLNIDPDELSSYQICGSPAYILVYIGCSKSAFGEKAIQQVNTLLDKYRDNEIAGYYLQWLGDAEKIEYRQLVKRVSTQSGTVSPPPPGGKNSNEAGRVTEKNTPRGRRANHPPDIRDSPDAACRPSD